MSLESLTVEELRERCELLAAIERRLTTIKQLWDELPTIDEVTDFSTAAASFAGSLAEAATRWDALDVTEDDLEQLARPATELVASLREAAKLQAG
jgi:hypothetical protein